MALKSPVAPTYGVDLAIGFTGFFAVIFFIVTVYCELTGQPALTWALVLLVLVLVLWRLFRRRARILRSAAEAAPEQSGGA